MAERNVPYADFDLYTRSETTVDAALKHAALDAATIAVDNALKRRVELKVAGALGLTSRVYRPLPLETLWIDDFVEDTPGETVIVENGTTLTANTHYVLGPLNGRSPSGEPVPYDRAFRVGTLAGSSQSWYTDGFKPTVTVTARYGWPAIPPVIVEMTKLVGKAMLEARNFSLGVVALTEGGAFGARETKLVKDAIRDYQLKRKALTFG